MDKTHMHTGVRSSSPCQMCRYRIAQLSAGEQLSHVHCWFKIKVYEAVLLQIPPVQDIIASIN